MRAKGKCPSCGEKVSAEDFLCPNCELILDASKVPPRPPGRTEVSVVRRMMEIPQRGLPAAQPPPRPTPTASSSDATRVLAIPPEVNGVPIVVASLTRKAMALSEMEAWIVSLIDGSSEAPALAKKAGIGELELRVVLHSLHQKRVVDFADEPFRDEPLAPGPPEAPPPLTEDEPLNLPSPSHDADMPSVIVGGTLLADATPPPAIVRGTPEPDATPPPPPKGARQAFPPPGATPPAPPTPPPPAPEATPPPAPSAPGRRAPQTRPLPPPPPAAARVAPDKEAARATSPRRAPAAPARANAPSVAGRAAEADARSRQTAPVVTRGPRQGDGEPRPSRHTAPAGRSAPPQPPRNDALTPASPPEPGTPADGHAVRPMPPASGGEMDGPQPGVRLPASKDVPAPPPPPADAFDEEAPALPPPPPPPVERTDPRIAYKGRASQKVLDALKQVKRRDGAPPAPPRVEPESSSVNVADIHAEPSLQVALRMEQGGRFDEAIRFLEKCIAKSPDAPSLYNRLAIILLRERSDFGRAESLLRKAVELAPENKVYAMNLTQVLSRAALKSQKR